MSGPEQPEVHQSAAKVAADALGVFVSAMAGIEQATPDSAGFWDRMCEAVCGTVAVQRAVLLLYDEGRRRVRPVGTFGIDRDRFRPEGVGLEDAPLSRVALEQDRVVDTLDADVAGEDGRRDVAPDLKNLPEGALAYVPIIAGGFWYGVLIAEHRDDAPLAEADRDALWIAGKVVAFAAVARRATRAQEHARQLSARLLLARQVHEQVIQRLFGVGLVLASGDPLAGEGLERARQEVEAAQVELRDLLHGPDLQHSPPTALRLGEEIDRLRRALSDQIELRSTVEPGVEVPLEHESLAQSVLGEAVRNAMKHGSPSVLDVRLARKGDDAIALTVDSDGARATEGHGSGLGLKLAAVEALQAGGLLEFGARGEDGWRVRLLLPSHEEQDEDRGAR
ncbi:GAF domain-containing protein [Patulibacter brassicae]|jgi:signal transduction histidine kinase|uniref:GAF domain-containing protein n=1 Tax=Patulibacter brassicae TaxID=1705717 RepID=A0ABU4VPW8_9ACTN|nr:GAF domain-containing protein [Patulibacter brassicae]MDX8153906.1 GAF domain-containing protein [Patulibacter brassicae]